MQYIDTLTSRDQQLAAAAVADFLPQEIYDIHTHPYHADHFAPNAWPFLSDKKILGCVEHRAALQRYMPAKKIHGLYFGMPHKTADRGAMNTWVAGEVRAQGTPLSRAMKVAVDDLHAHALARQGTIQRPQNVHFTPAGSEELAGLVTQSILSELTP